MSHRYGKGNTTLFLKTFFRERIKTKDFYLGLAIITFGLVIVCYLIPVHVEIMDSAGSGIKGDFFPKFIAIILLILGIALAVNSHKTSQNISRVDDKRVNWGTIGLAALLFCFYFGIEFIGMAPMGVLIVFVLMRIYGFKNWIWGAVFSILFVLFLFFFFEKLAQVDIPRGMLFEGLY